MEVSSEEFVILVIQPQDAKYAWSLDKIQTTVEWAIDDLGLAGLLGPRDNNFFTVHTLDSECSQYRTNVKLTNLFYEQPETLRPSVIIGPTDVLTVVEASRFGTHLDVPVITAGGSASTCRNEFRGAPMLTRVGHTDNKLADAVESLLKNNSWTRVALVYRDSQSTCYGNTCYFRMLAIKEMLNRTTTDLTMDRRYRGPVELASIKQEELKRTLPEEIESTLQEVKEVARGKIKTL
ncbi:hypothetical protein Bbelb_262860 [Branchiostoma belcheri]|nr:hypothetical protein Bbelb_262860 [Branchiostoma belcheri]